MGVNDLILSKEVDRFSNLHIKFLLNHYLFKGLRIKRLTFVSTKNQITAEIKI